MITITADNSLDKTSGYLNGVYVSNVSSVDATFYFDGFKIGRNRNGDAYFNGVIDDVKIYNKALTADEISEIYNSSFSPVESCLLYTSPSPRDLSTSRMPSSA